MYWTDNCKKHNLGQGSYTTPHPRQCDFCVLIFSFRGERSIFIFSPTFISHGDLQRSILCLDKFGFNPIGKSQKKNVLNELFLLNHKSFIGNSRLDRPPSILILKTLKEAGIHILIPFQRIPLRLFQLISRNLYYVKYDNFSNEIWKYPINTR